MRTAVFTDTFLPQVNGVTNTLKRMGDYLEKNHMEYMFAAPEQGETGSVPYNVETFFSAPFVLYPECRFTVPNMFRLSRKLETFKPDMIFLMTEAAVGLSGLLYAKQHGIPVVSNYSTNFTTILDSYNLSLFTGPLEKYLAWFHSFADFTVTPSEESEKVLHGMGVLETGIFGRGIDFDNFNPIKRSRDLRRSLGVEDRVMLLYVGRISPEKDLAMLPGVMERLNAGYGDRISLVMTGDGPMREELEQRMPENVIFTGYRKGDDLALLYASADIFAFPSSFETFGNVVLEAMASGIPAVGVNKGGVAGLIRHGSTGYLGEAFSEEEMAANLEKLIVNEIDRARFGQEARKFAETRSWDSVFDGLWEMFADHAGEHKKQKTA